MTDLTLPSIHLNGTGRKMLTEDYTAAYDAVHNAIRALRNIEFNARDYYTQGADAFHRARTQRDVQLHHLDEVQQYVRAHLFHLSE
jgi:hypothetical protein